nr:class I SAM-dependent methyltransferase [Streptomyces sp. NRRL B-24484]
MLNHVGRPGRALAELRRVARPGGRIALTVWAHPAPAGQSLLGRAVAAAGVVGPPYLPPPPGEDELPHGPDGLVRLLTSAGPRGARCDTLHWRHRTGAEEWWSGPAAGVGFVGQVLLGQDEPTRERVRHHFDTLSREFLSLPRTALLLSAHR